MEVKIGKKTFKLERVSIYISEMYSELTQMAFDLADVTSDIEEVEQEYLCDLEDGMSEPRAKLKRIKAMKAIRQGGKAAADKMYLKRFDILEEVLTLNGYDYDYELWHTQADTEMVNDIMVELVGGKKGKKKEA